MNRLLEGYVFQIIFNAILLVLTVILGLDIISAIIAERGELEGGYTLWKSIQYVLLTTPSTVYEMLPFAALIGCLAGLGVLAGNSELVVMRAAGISTGRIIWLVFRPTLLILLFGFLISEYVAPISQSIAQSQKASAQRNASNMAGKGLWHKEGGRYMHFSVVQPNGVLYGVTVFELDSEHQLQSTLYAERASFQGDYWLLEDVNSNRIGERKISRQQSASQRWETDLTPELLNILVLNPLDLPVAGLWKYSRYLQSQGLNNQSYALALWKKLLQPLSTLVLVLIGVSFIFGPLREVTMGFRIFIGVLVGIVFRTVQDMLAPASLVYGFPPLYASLLPIIVCLLIGLLLLRRAR